MTSVVVGAAASELPHALGPRSWVVLKELLVHSNRQAGEWVASISIRSVAVSHDIEKDTAARAVRRLRDFGMVPAVQRRADARIFESRAYEMGVQLDRTGADRAGALFVWSGHHRPLMLTIGLIRPVDGVAAGRVAVERPA